MNSSKYRGVPKSSNVVRIVGVIAIVLVVTLTAVLLRSTHHKEAALAKSSASTTTTANPTGGPSTSAPTGGPGTTAPSTTLDTLAQPESDVLTSAQLQYQNSQAKSGLSETTWDRATAAAKAFVTASATGAGVENYAAYYDQTYINRPWIKDFTIQWAAAQPSGLSKITKATVWYTGIPVTTGRPVGQVIQTVYLDSATMTPMHDEAVRAAGITVPLTCCVQVIQ